MDLLPISTGSPPKRPPADRRSRRSASRRRSLSRAPSGAGAAGPRSAQAEAARAGASVRIQCPSPRRQDGRGPIRHRERLLPVPRKAEVQRRAGACWRPRPALPAGKIKDDEFFGKVETYRGQIAVSAGARPARAGTQGHRARRIAGLRGRRRVLSAAGPERHGHAAAAGNGPGAPVAATPARKSWFN